MDPQFQWRLELKWLTEAKKRSMQNVLINASNLHVGGGIQVAASVISELAGHSVVERDVSFLISDKVFMNLDSSKLNRFTKKGRLFRINVFGIDPFNRRFRNIVNQHAKVLTIFGPLYLWRTSGQNIVGFAQAWIIFPDNEVYKLLPWPTRLARRIKYWVQSQYYKRADILIVELDHVKEGLVRVLDIDPERIHVIPNSVSSIYLDEASWHPVQMPDSQGALRLGFLGRNYLHKNTAIFPHIVDSLNRDHAIDAKFYVTFTEEEWQACTAEFRAACINVGPLSVAQCPNFYKNLDAVVFPSLLECFSATPIEAMVMERPLFASDRPFNRDVCKEHAQYFDPHKPDMVAAQIAAMLANGGPDPAALRAAKDHVLSFSSPVDRANRYLALLGLHNNQVAN